MAGDYTRYTFRPEDDRAAVLLQQGRVQLDADFNELVELLDRRSRVETVDIIGRTGVPRSTIVGFEIAGSGADLTIGIGRCYVDGLLAENRGGGAQRFEPVWGEHIGSDPTRVDRQPYLRPAPAPPTTGRHLVYLDVWYREITAAEQPELVEPAVGVDSATRLQTVWAVRVLEADLRASTCADNWDAEPSWVAATAPSAARLTTSATGTPLATDPCLVLPAGGYRGVENRLYRVEIHDDGSDPARPASMKWSRDNGSVAVEITAVTDPAGANPRVGVRRIGRDSILRFHDGDWVELLDDALEISGRPGVMARIAPGGVDAQANTLTLTQPLDGTIDLARRPRVRRWDQVADVDPQRGVVVIGTTPATFDLEDGVTVQIAVDGGRPRVGDFWAFAARTSGIADPAPYVELLVSEPPRGIRHHYARLAIIEAGEVVADCRVIYPPAVPEGHDDCACDVCVTPEDHEQHSPTIQEALNDVVDGGRVCLGVGTYVITEPLRIRRSRSVTLTGKGRETILAHTGVGPAIDVDGCVEVTIEQMTITGAATSIVRPSAPGGTRTLTTVPELGIVVRNTIGATIQRCFFVQAAALIGGGPLAPPATPSSPAAPVAAGIAIGLAGLLSATVIRENVIVADIGVASLTLDRPANPTPGIRPLDDVVAGAQPDPATAPHDFGALEGLPGHLVTIGLYVEDNLLACRRAGIDLGRAGPAKGASVGRTQLRSALLIHIGDTRIAGNSIYGCIEAAIIATGFVPGPNSSLRRAINRGPAPPGIVASGIASGGIVANLAAAPVNWLSPLALTSASRIDVRSNVAAVAGHGIVCGCDEARIESNDIAPTDPPIVADATGILLVEGAGAATLDHVDVIGNRVRTMAGYGIRSETRLAHVRVSGNVVDGPVRGGIVLLAAGPRADVEIDDNTVLEVELGPELDGWQIAPGAITVLGAQRIGVMRNRIDRIGLPQQRELATRAGIYVGAGGAVRICDNEVDGIGPSRPFAGRAVGIAVDRESEQVDVATNTVRVGAGAEIAYVYALAIGDVEGFEIRRGLGSQTASQPFRATLVAFDVIAGRIAITRNAVAVLTARADLRAAAVHGNALASAGRAPAALVNIDGHCAFSDNRCQANADDRFGAAVWLVAGDRGTVIVDANRVIGNPEIRSIVIDPMMSGENLPQVTVVGNVVNGGMWIADAGTLVALGPPWDALNIRI